MTRTTAIRVGLLALALFAAGPAGAQSRRAAPPADPVPPRALLAKARSWAYQLQNLDAGRLARTPHDVLVIDAGSGDGRYGLSSPQVQRLRRKPDGSRRLVIAYINIGEAEDYRAYWRKAWEAAPPAWLGAGNARWKGDHRVRHWHPDWQAIVFGSQSSIVGRVLAAGYDGIYMDRVDIYQLWCGERPTAFADMVDFVAAISRWAKAQRPGFLVLPQNGEELLQDARYRAAIDGIGKEDLVFGDRGNDTQNYATRIERADMLLGFAHRDGLPVFAIEYARRPDNQAIARAHHARYGHVLYFGPRSLAYLGQSGPANAEDGDTEPYHAERGPLGCGG